MGFLGRITRVHVLAVGCVVFVGVGLAFTMLVMQPRLKELRSTRQQVNGQKAAAAGLERKLEELAAAQAAYVDAKRKFEAILAKQPPLSTSDPIQAAFDLWREFGPGPTSTGTILWRHFARRGYDISGITVPQPPLPPYTPPPVISWSLNLGLRARSFGEVLRFLRTTEEIPRLMLISSVNGISGHPPSLQVPLPATVFIITANARPAEGAPGAVMAGGAPAATESTGDE